MPLADLVADLPHLPQRFWREPQLLPGIRVGVDHEVGVEVICIDVRCHQDFAAGEELFRQLQRDLVGLVRGDVLLGREGLNVLVEKGPVRFPVQILVTIKACCASSVGQLTPVR